METPTWDRVRLDLVSGWLVVMHTYLYNYPLSLSHCCTTEQALEKCLLDDGGIVQKRTDRKEMEAQDHIDNNSINKR